MSDRILPQCTNKVDHLFLPNEYRNPDELYLGISYLKRSEEFKKFKLPLKIEANFMLVKDSQALLSPENDKYNIKIVSLIPSRIIKRIYEDMPKDFEKVSSIFSCALTMNFFSKVIHHPNNALYGLAFLNHRKSYSHLWVTSPSKEFIPLLSKFLYPRYGKLVGFFHSDLIKKYNDQIDQILSNTRGIRFDDILYDFRELDEEKASYHSFSREYCDLSPEEVATAVMERGKEIVEYAVKEKGLKIEIELTEDEEFKEFVQGIEWARSQETI